MNGIATPPPNRRIAALRGSSRTQIQALLGHFAARLAERGFVVAGAVETAAPGPAGGCRRLALRDLSNGAVTSISQNLGPESTACNLDTSGLAEVCARVERAIAQGAHLVVLSKFGKQEAERGGLSDAFRAAVEAGLPVLTAVSPAMAEPWQLFAGQLSEYLLADLGSVEAWWSRSKAGTLFARPLDLVISGQAGGLRRARFGARGRR